MGSGGRTPPEKDYFEPGVPDDLVRPSHTDQDSGTQSIGCHNGLVGISAYDPRVSLSGRFGGSTRSQTSNLLFGGSVRITSKTVYI